MDNILEILDEIERSDERSVLATIIKVEGSAYRKEGTTMLFFESGRQIGVLSAGCLEADLAARADMLLSKPDVSSRTFVYDTSAEDDLSWGRGAGCNGIIHILLEKVDKQNLENLRILKKHLDSGTPVTAAKVLGEDSSVTRTIFVTHALRTTKSGTQYRADTGTKDVYQSFSKPFWIKTCREEKCGIQYVQGLGSDVYIHHFRPKPRLFLFGAGPDARPLAAMAHQTGFSINIWDWRPTYCNPDYFPDAYLFLTPSIQEALGQLALTPSDSVVMMTHDFQKDQELLQSLLRYRQVSYLGILGPRKRTSRLLEGKSIPKRLHSPVGLDIGADGPEEIAVSILADVIRTQRTFTSEKRRAFEQTRDYRDLSGGGVKSKVWGM